MEHFGTYSCFWNNWPTIPLRQLLVIFFFGIALHHPDLFFGPMFLVLHSKLWHIILLKIMRRLLTRNSEILYQLVKVLNLMEILHFSHLIIIERTIELYNYSSPHLATVWFRASWSLHILITGRISWYLWQLCGNRNHVLRFVWLPSKGLPLQATLCRVTTCLRICAAIWWLQSKMMRNSRLLFISFRRGLVSCVSRGSWRIFSLMLYLEGAIISSCSLIRP